MTITETEKNVYRKLFSNKKKAHAKTYRTLQKTKAPAKAKTMATQKKAIRNALEKRLMYNIKASDANEVLSLNDTISKKKSKLIRFRGIKVA